MPGNPGGGLLVPLVSRDDGAVRKSLSVRQVQVLQWIVNGCPDNDWEPVNYRMSAQVLHDLKLVKVTGRRRHWKAEVTEAGRQYLAGEVGLDGDASSARKPRLAPAALDERVRGLLERLEADEFHIVANLPVEGDVDWAAVIDHLRARPDLLQGRRIRTRTSNGAYGRAPKSVSVALLPASSWLTRPPEDVVADESMKLHPKAAEVMDYSTSVTGPLKKRARRILHSLFAEAEARGWEFGTAQVSTYGGPKNAYERGALGRSRPGGALRPPRGIQEVVVTPPAGTAGGGRLIGQPMVDLVVHDGEVPGRSADGRGERDDQFAQLLVGGRVDDRPEYVRDLVGIVAVVSDHHEHLATVLALQAPDDGQAVLDNHARDRHVPIGGPWADEVGMESASGVFSVRPAAGVDVNVLGVVADFASSGHDVVLGCRHGRWRCCEAQGGGRGDN